MEKFIAVDSGKFATKFAWASDDLKSYSLGRFRTKMSHGSFDDDAIESGTWVCEIDGKVMKLGNGALQDADLESSKMNDMHRACTILAIALVVNDGDDVKVAIGCPMNEYSNVEKRVAYKNFILPTGQVKVRYKAQRGDIITKSFNITGKYVYPESAGGLYLDMVRNKDVAAIVDIGNLNVNASYFTNFEPDFNYSLTSEMGGQILISNLAAELSASFTRCDERLVSGILKAPLTERYLHPVRPDKEIEEKSKALITEALTRHVKLIRRMCDSKNWPLDYMQLTFIGGTSALLENEIRQVFGEEVIIPDRPEYANAIGFLRRLIAWEKDTILPLKQDQPKK